MSEIYEFVNLYVIKKKAKEVIDCIKDNSKRTSNGDTIKASYFLNIMINFDAIMPSKTEKLNEFLVSKGADYSIVNRFGGRDETVFVIFNNCLISSDTKFEKETAMFDF